MSIPRIAAMAIAFLLLVRPQSGYADYSTAPPPAPAELKVDLIFSGGHDTVGVDRGRPVILIAAALNVPPEVFREAFSHVKPAGPGQQPQEAQVRLNKQALMERLGPLGVTDDRLNEVSNYYRYRRESGELWRHADAAGFAVVRDNKIVSITITNPGAGYTTPPQVSLPVGITVYPMAVLAFGTDLAMNGSIAKIELNPIDDEEHAPSRILPAPPTIQDVPIHNPSPSSP
jgi:hypothetical protein